MTTSGITDWSLTASDVCKAAAQELGVIGSGENLTDDEEDDCLLRLNAMLRSWSVEGNLYREATGEIAVTGGVGNGTISASVRDISALRYVNDDGTERPLAVWNRSQYLVLPDKTTAGAPTIYYYTKGVSLLTVYIWPVPANDCTLKVDYSRTAETVTDGAQTLDIPQDWQEAVIKGLGVAIANMFGKVRTDAATVQKLAIEAEQLRTRLLDADRPDSYVFETWDA